MIYIGTDIVKVSRVKNLLVKYPDRFRQYVFTDTEVDYCQSKACPEVHFSGRFAAKEAVKKAIFSYRPDTRLSFHDINIVPVKNSAPTVSITGKIINFHSLKVSISHTDENATAVALMEA